MFYAIDTVFIQPAAVPIVYHVQQPSTMILYFPSTNSIPVEKSIVEEKQSSNSATNVEDTKKAPIRLTAEEQLELNLARNGCRRQHVDGDGNCFFTSIASQLIELFHEDRSFRQAIRKRLNLTENMFQNSTQLARLLRKLICLEWKVNEDKYKPYINDVNYKREIRKFRSDKFYSSILGDVLPLAMCNLIGIPMKIITNLSECPLIDVCPQDDPLLSIRSSPVLLLAYNQENGGHYDIALENRS